MDLRLRPIEWEDLPQLQVWRNDPQLRHRMREWRLLNMEDQEDWFARVSKSDTDRMFGIVKGKSLIGVCGLCHINWKDRHAEISLYVGSLIHRRDASVWSWVLGELARIAFNEYGLHRLWAEVYAFFEFGGQQLEENGYTLEGALRETVWHYGKWWAARIYGLLAQEWSVHAT